MKNALILREGRSITVQSLCRRYRGFVNIVSRNCGVRATDFEDVFQETMVRVLNHVQNQQEPIHSLKPWLATLVRRVIFDRHRVALAVICDFGSAGDGSSAKQDKKRNTRTINVSHWAAIRPKYFVRHRDAGGLALSLEQVPDPDSTDWISPLETTSDERRVRDVIHPILQDMAMKKNHHLQILEDFLARRPQRETSRDLNKTERQIRRDLFEAKESLLFFLAKKPRWRDAMAAFVTRNLAKQEPYAEAILEWRARQFSVDDVAVHLGLSAKRVGTSWRRIVRLLGKAIRKGWDELL